jgi:hypothetical protein
MANMSFSMQIAEFIAKTKGNRDLVVRAVAKKIDDKIIERSPVGDPSTWARNPNVRKVFGKVRVKKDWQLGFMSGETSSFRMGGMGYVGGRFRANWQISIGSAASGTLDLADKDGAATAAAHAAVIGAAKAGDVIYIVNNLPYARRIENGWSKQAPIGLVALTIVEFQTIVDNAVNGVRAGTSSSDFTQGYSTYKL